MKLIIEPTEGDALDTRMVKGADNLNLNAPFFNLKFVKESPAERAGVVLRTEENARQMLEREVRFNMNPDSTNYRAVMPFENGLGVQVMAGGMASYSDVNRQLFEVAILQSQGRGRRFDYLSENPFTTTQVGEFLNAEQANELIERVRAHKS